MTTTVSVNPSSKVVYAFLQKAGIAGSQVCLVEVPPGGKLTAQQPQQQSKREISLDFDDSGDAAAASPSPSCFGGTKIVDSSQHFRKRKMLQEPRLLLDSEEAAALTLPASAARIVLGAGSASAASSQLHQQPDSKIRSESENLVLQKAPLESSSAYSISFDELDDSDLLSTSSYYGRKRARLNHLTSDEKMTRRKVMNRIAAQQARDRKKQKMEKMETALQRLEVENRYLRCENGELKEKLEKLGSRLNHLLVQLEGGCGQGVSALSGARPTPADRTAAGAGSGAPAHDAGARAAAGSSGCPQRQQQQRQQQRQQHQQRVEASLSTGGGDSGSDREVSPAARGSGQQAQVPGLGGRQLAAECGAGDAADAIDGFPGAAWPAAGVDGDILAGIDDLLDGGAALQQLDSLLLCGSPDAPSSESGVFSEEPLLPGLESPVSDDLSAWLDINN